MEYIAFITNLFNNYIIYIYIIILIILIRKKKKLKKIISCIIFVFYSSKVFCLFRKLMVSIIILLLAIVIGKYIFVFNFRIVVFSRMIWISLLVISLISFFVLALLLAYIGIYAKFNRIQTIQTGSTLIINLIFFYLYRVMKSYYKLKNVNKKDFQMQIGIYKKQLHILKKLNKNIQALRHDMKHHLKELRYLVHNKQIDEAEKYIMDMEKFMGYSKEYVLSGNCEIDSTLNYFLEKAHKVLNEVNSHIVLPEDLSINIFFLNIVVANLMDNAIDAAKQSVQKKLKVDMRVVRGMLLINVSNSYSGIIKMREHFIMSSKRGNKKLGIGLQNVRRVVEEQNGQMEIKWGEVLFEVNVMFYLYKLKI